MKEKFIRIAASLILVASLIACGNDNKEVKTVKADQTKKDPFIGVWSSTAWSLEQNVTLVIKKNEDGTYHFVYKKGEVKKEADYILGKKNSGGYPFLPKNTKCVFNGDVDAVETNAGNWRLGVRFNNGSKGQPDEFAKLGSPAIYEGNWVTNSASPKEYYILRILNFDKPTYQVELDRFKKSSNIVTQKGKYTVSKDRKILLLMSKKGPFTTIHLTKDKDGNLQVVGLGNLNSHKNKLVFKVYR